MRVPTRTDQELTTLFRQGLPAAGMPAFANLTEADTTALIQFLRTIKPRAGSAPEHKTVTLDRGSLSGATLLLLEAKLAYGRATVSPASPSHASTPAAELPKDSMAELWAASDNPVAIHDVVPFYVSLRRQS